MRKLMLIALAAIVVVGAGVLSVRHYNQYQIKVAQENQAKAEQAAQVAAEQKVQAEATKTRIFDQYTQVRIECEKSKGYYARLTSFQKQGIQAPGGCGPAVIE